MKNTRPISWIKAARKDFEDFPEVVQHDMLTALTVAAEGKNRTMPSRSGALMAAYLKSHFGIVGTPFALFMP
jgi:phage-related protein